MLVLEPRVFQDERGLFFESYNKRSFRKATGIAPDFVQDNVSRSAKNVIRGLHYQVGRPQGKLIRVVSGRIFDVAVDLRRSSASFRRWIGIELSQVQLVWIPPGFAHGFLVLSDSAEVHYKVTEFWDADSERGLAWND
ncbi:MAG TPA: dTDP-4-dehydrorhamnose 3,5-epimerase, partial [Hyphomicrobiaceae bacterium]